MEPQTENEMPKDDRNWVSATEAAIMLRLGRKRTMHLANERGMEQRKAHHSAEPFYLRSDINTWVDLRSLRWGWLAKRKELRREKRWTEKIDAETAQRLFITSDQAAALLGVTRATVTSMVRFGRLVCYQTEPGRRGARLWFSRRAVMQIVEDPDHIKRRESYQKRKSYDKANRQGRIPTARRVHKGVPKGWLTVREAALRMGVSPNRVLQMRQSRQIKGEQIWRKNKPLRYWYFPDYEIERYLAWRQQAKEAKGQPLLSLPGSAPTPPPETASETKPQAIPAVPSRRKAPPEPSPLRLDADSPEPKWACDDVDLTRAFFLLDSP